MRVLIVEDDPTLARALAITMRARGYEVDVAGSAREAGRLLGEREVGVVILDLGLPDADGLSVLTQLRGWSEVPVVVLSARHDPAQKVKALDAGANDYVTKPFNIDELFARLRAATRGAEPGEQRRTVETASFMVDLARHVVVREGQEVTITPTEWRLLEVLARQPGVLVERTALLEVLRGPLVPHSSHYLRVYIQQLRAKLEPSPANPRHLMTVPGQGYRLDL